MQQASGVHDTDVASFMKISSACRIGSLPPVCSPVPNRCLTDRAFAACGPQYSWRLSAGKSVGTALRCRPRVECRVAPTAHRGSAGSIEAGSAISRTSPGGLRDRRLLDAKPLHAIAHGAKGNAQELRRRRPVVARLFERLVDRRALDAVEVVLQRPLVARGKRRVGLFGWWSKAQVLGGDLLGIGRQRESTLQDVLQLAHVAGEWVRLQGDPRLSIEL